MKGVHPVSILYKFIAGQYRPVRVADGPITARCRFIYRAIRAVGVAETIKGAYPLSILYKSIAGRYRPVRVADGPITPRYRLIKNVSWAVGVVGETIKIQGR